MFQIKRNSPALQYPPCEFNGKRIPWETLIGNDVQSHKKFNYPLKKMVSVIQKDSPRSKSIPPSMRELQSDQVQITLTERVIQPKRISILLPFQKAVEKIRNQNREVFTRRKSCYGSIFGEMMPKQLINFPTVIEMHKRFNGKEFALSSFADILRKNQKKVTKRASLTRKLSKQMSLIEYDNMERPPSCKTPRESKILIMKKISTSTMVKERQIEGMKQKLFHFMNDSKSRKTQLNSMPFQSKIKQRNETLKLKSCVTEFLISSQRSPASSCRTTTYKPYQKQNELLSKLIKTEHKSRSHYVPKSPINIFGY